MLLDSYNYKERWYGLSVMLTPTQMGPSEKSSTFSTAWNFQWLNGFLKLKSLLKRGWKLKVGNDCSGNPCGVGEPSNYPGFIAANCRRPTQIKNLMCSAFRNHFELLQLLEHLPPIIIVYWVILEGDKNCKIELSDDKNYWKNALPPHP